MKEPLLKRHIGVSLVPMADIETPPPGSVTVINVGAWRSRTTQLGVLLQSAGLQPEGARTVSNLDSTPPSGQMDIAIISDPDYWSSDLNALDDALFPVTGATTSGTTTSSAAAAADGVERLTLTVEEAATMLGVSRAGAYDAVARGEIPSIRIGRRILVPRAALERWLAGGAPNEPPPLDVDAERGS